jgi:hypothetical protein
MAEHDGTLTAQRMPYGRHHNPVGHGQHADDRPLRAGPGRWVIAGVGRGWNAIIVVRARWIAPHEA